MDIQQIGRLLQELWTKDPTFHIEQDAFSTDVRVMNRSDDESLRICIESPSLATSVEKVWALVCKGEVHAK